MYPVNLGYDVAVQRMQAMSANGHHAEALVAVAFTVEKTLRRTLRQLVVSAGFPSTLAEKLVNNLRGLDAIKKAWEFYDPRNRPLLQVVNQADWDVFKTIASMRNDLVHGVKVYKLQTCATETAAGLASLDNLKTALDIEYGYSGWTRGRVRRNTKLHADPAVKWTR